MAILSLRSFTGLVSDQAAAVQASARQFVDYTAGSLLRALAESSASVGLWMQWIIVQVLALTRAATSTGADLDTWVADYGMARLPAVAASGAVTFSRQVTGQAALILPGVQVKTADGTQIFTVSTDTANAAWSVTLSGYSVGSGVASVIVPVAAATAGALGNVLAGTITLLASAIANVDAVTNALGYANGINAETDAALRDRFQDYINSRSRATEVAVAYAVNSVQQGLTLTVQENVTAGGTFTPGTFVVSFDDGSGAPSAGLIALVTAAVQTVRPLGSVAVVRAATVTAANISMTITCATVALKNAAIPLVSAAITSYIAALAVGQILPYSMLARLAYNASGDVQNVTVVLLNGGTADIVTTNSAVVRIGTLAVN